LPRVRRKSSPENLSRDPEQEYFAEGMTEALISTLAKIGALRVVSRNLSSVQITSNAFRIALFRFVCGRSRSS